MKINLKKAVQTFHPSPSLEQIYFEAIANAIDAGADKISIKIAIEAFDKPDTLRLVIQDNGRGFTDLDFDKFSSLLEVDSPDHKGLGRLVFLAYFNEVAFESCFGGDKKRTFEFNTNFNGECAIVDHNALTGTKIDYRYFSGERVKSYGYLIPNRIKESILQHFFPLLFAKKEAKGLFQVDISLEIKVPNYDQEFVSGAAKLTLDDLPILKKETIQESSLDFYQNIDIHYSIAQDFTREKFITTSICIDGRAINYDLVSIESIPSGYQLAFFFASEFFIGKTNASRQKLDLPDEITEKNLRTILRKAIGRIIATEIPKVVEENQKIEGELDKVYPHLAGYYPKDITGLIVRTVALEEAQKSFFNDQKKLLECENLDDGRYEKALELSARALMEYVLYRARIIEKLKLINPKNSEAEIHGLIVPMKRNFDGENLVEDVYNNNVWMLDDKYMSYDSVLSDKEMTEVVKKIALDDLKDAGRPDITIVFSSDPQTSDKVSVVVIELKRKDVELAKKEEVVSQLRQRARKLLSYFDHKIERIWFYGITDIDQEFRRSLKEDQFKELFSHGQVFYKPQPIIVTDEDNPFIVDLFVMNYDALIQDAESRNATFIRILRSRIASFIDKSTG